MAIYRFEAKIISRGGGQSSVASAAYRTGRCATSAAAYRAGQQLTDERTGETHDYTRKRGVLGAEIMLPEGAPAWMGNRSVLWNAVEWTEKRKDAQLARDFILSLPHELSGAQRVALTQEFVRKQFAARGYVADIAWHAPDKSGGLNFHAHVMVPMRRVEGEGFARFKERGPPGEHPSKVWKDELARLREAWATSANRHLEAAGFEGRLDHRSLEAQGIDRTPEPKQGPIATQMEREGRESFAGSDRRETQVSNTERQRLREEHAEAQVAEAQIIDLMVERLRRGEMGIEPLSEEMLRLRPTRETAALRELQEQDARIQAFKLQKEHEAEEAKRKRETAERDEARRSREGDIASAEARYSIALGERYDVRDPYGSLARAGLAEYAAFHRNQESLRSAIAKEQDAGKRRVIELRREIEAHEYMAVTSQRLAGISAVIAGRENAPQAVLDRERAAAYQSRANELREDRSRLIEDQRLGQEREKQARTDAANANKPPVLEAGPVRQAATDPTKQVKLEKIQASNAAYQDQSARKDPEAARTEPAKGDIGKQAAEPPVKVSGRQDADTETADAKQAKLDKIRASNAAYQEHGAQETEATRARNAGKGDTGKHEEAATAKASDGKEGEAGVTSARQTPDKVQTSKAADLEQGAQKDPKPTHSNTGKGDTGKHDEAATAKMSGRKEGAGEAEMTDAKQTKLAKIKASNADYKDHHAKKDIDRQNGGGGRTE